MINCKIEVNHYTTNSSGEREFSHSTTEYILSFPVVPLSGQTVVVNPRSYSERHEYMVLGIEYRTEIDDCGTGNVEVYIVCEEM